MDLKDHLLEVKHTGIDLNELKNLFQAPEEKRIAIDLQEVKVRLEELKKLLEKIGSKEGFQTQAKTRGGKQPPR